MIKSSTTLPGRNDGLVFMLIFAGVLLRLFHYFDNRSLWEDEVFLASSLIHMNFYELATQPLEYQQRAPVGFLWLVRLCVVLFNTKEMALRLIPLLSGIASLLLFVPVVRFFLTSRRGQITAIAIAAMAPPLVYHSVEVKQYATALLATVVSLYLYTRYHAARSVGQLAAWGGLGALVLWFSFSALFVLAGIALAVLLSDFLKKDWRAFFLRFLPFGSWFISFVVLYIFFIRRFPEEEWLVQFWRNRGAFLPFPPKSVQDLLWPFRQIYSLIRYPLGLSWFDLSYTEPHSQWVRFLARMPMLPMLVGMLGVITLYRFDKKKLLLLAMPVLIALAASAFELYPLRERLTLFLAPLFILTIARGVEGMALLTPNSSLSNLVLVVLLAAPFMNSAWQLVDTDLFGDYKKSRQREAMQYMGQQYRPGDVVYVYWNNLPSYRYYEEVYALHFPAIYGSDVRYTSTSFESYFNNLAVDFDRIPGHKRLWYVYKPYNGLKLGDIEKQPAWYYINADAVSEVLAHLSGWLGKGQLLFPEGNQTTDVRVYLFDLSHQKERFPDGKGSTKKP